MSAEDVMEFDLEANPVDPRGRRTYLERFIHGEIYRARCDVQATSAVIPRRSSTVRSTPG